MNIPTTDGETVINVSDDFIHYPYSSNNYYSTKLIKVTDNVTQYPYTYDMLRNDFLNISFPTFENLNFEDLKDLGVFYVENTVQPVCNFLTEDVVEDTPVLVDGKWKQKFSIVQRTEEQIEEYKKIVLSALSLATENKLNEFVKMKDYDNVDSLSKYKNITDEEINVLPESNRLLITKFREECRYASVLIANTWASLFLIFDEIEKGEREFPRNFEEIESDLPELIWQD
jgi:hypothetical protein